MITSYLSMAKAGRPIGVSRADELAAFLTGTSEIVPASWGREGTLIGHGRGQSCKHAESYLMDMSWHLSFLLLLYVQVKILSRTLSPGYEFRIVSCMASLFPWLKGSSDILSTFILKSGTDRRQVPDPPFPSRPNLGVYDLSSDDGAGNHLLIACKPHPATRVHFQASI